MSDYDTDMEESVSRVDRLGELPNSLIHLILSFLPMKDVVRTTLLSKGWKNLWTTVSCLNFYDLMKRVSRNGEQTEQARRFVNRALICWRGVEILKFEIDIDWDFESSLAGDIDLWVRFAVEHKVQELNLSLVYDEGEMDWENSKKDAYGAPVCLNSCSSLRKLSLVGCNLFIPVSPAWNQLKSLKINGFCFSERLINRILLGSPQLEVFELRLLESYDNLNIWSTSLIELKIRKYLINDDDEISKDKVLRIFCPNLEILELSGVLYPKYLFTDVSSVTDVTLAFDGVYDYPYENESIEETMKQIFATFQHVDKVTLSHWCVQVLGAVQKKYSLPSLPNVKFFPNLKMLVIQDQVGYSLEFDSSIHLEFETKIFDASKYLEFETKLSKSFMLQLKFVDISSFLFNASTFRFIEILLKEASTLEKLVIRVKMFLSNDWFKVAEDLLCMPRSSPFARVVLKKY